MNVLHLVCCFRCVGDTEEITDAEILSRYKIHPKRWGSNKKRMMFLLIDKPIMSASCYWTSKWSSSRQQDPVKFSSGTHYYRGSHAHIVTIAT